MKEKEMIDKGWNNLEKIPPNKLVEVMDEHKNIRYAYPTYYPFELIKKPGDEKKMWGWRATPVFYEDGQSKWDGGWMIKSNLSEEPIKIGTIKYWREIENEVLDTI